jgi:hypothetical protein
MNKLKNTKKKTMERIRRDCRLSSNEKKKRGRTHISMETRISRENFSREGIDFVI